MKFKSYYWAIIAAAVLAILAIAVPTLIFRGGGNGDTRTNPHSPEELAQLQEQSLDFSPQIQAYMDLLNANPADAAAMSGLGKTYVRSGMYAEAVQWFSKAIEVAPNDPENYSFLGAIYYEQGLTDLAVREFEKGLAIDPNNQAILLDIGTLYFQTGQQDKAKQFWQRAYDIDPNSEYGRFAQQQLAGGDTIHGTSTETTPAAPTPAP